MKYRIVADSCCELPEELRNDEKFCLVPLDLSVDQYHIKDDENFNQEEFLRHVAESEVCPKSACPSPDRYMEAYHCDADHIFVVTLTSKLSGSYNSARLAAELYEEQYGEKKIHIIDSESASCGETQIVYKLIELEEKGLSFEEIRDEIEAFRSSLNTFFVLDDLETLRKNGRLSTVKALVASTLNIKPIMMGDKGLIAQIGQAMGMKKALAKLVEIIKEKIGDGEKKTIIISYCACRERAEHLRKLLMEHLNVKEILLQNTAGVSSMYANRGGIIVTV